jgi:hypothetical protein
MTSSDIFGVGLATTLTYEPALAQKPAARTMPAAPLP